jgi:hypothetical protein
MLCFYLTERETARNMTASRYLFYAFAACCALGVLTKGLIGIVFPLTIVLTYLVLTRGGRGAVARIRQLHPLSSLLLFLLIAAPWHILIAIANPTEGHPGNLSWQHGHWTVPLPTEGNVHGWLWFYFVNEQLLRYLNLRIPRDYDTVPLWLFWALCLVWLMPWSAFVFHAFARAIPLRSKLWRERFHRVTLTSEERTMLLLAVWAAVPLLFFSFSTRQEYYVLPALPALTLLLARLLGRRLARGDIRVDRLVLRTTGILAFLGLAAAAICICLVACTANPAPDVDLSSLLQQNPANYALSLGHFLDLNLQAMAAFRLPLAISTMTLGLGLSVAWYLRRPVCSKKSPRARNLSANLVTAAAAFGFLLAIHLALRTFSPVIGSQELARAIALQLQPTGSLNPDLIVIHQEYEYASTLGFYLHRSELHLLEGRSSNLWYGSFFPDAPAIFETPKALAARWLGPQRIFLWQDMANIPSPLPVLPGPVYVVAESDGKEIVSNQPNHPLRPLSSLVDTSSLKDGRDSSPLQSEVLPPPNHGVRGEAPRPEAQTTEVPER